MSTPASEQELVAQDAIGRDLESVVATSTIENYKKLAEWVTKHGGFIHPDLEIVHDSQKGFHAVVKDGKQLSAEVQIASSPMPVTLSVLNVLNIAPFEQHGTAFPEPFLEKYRFATDILQTFFLMEQHVLASKSFWAPYLGTLPSVEDVDNQQFESDDDVRWIRGTNLEAAIASQSRRWYNAFEEANKMLRELNWPSSVRDEYSFPLYRWASTIFGSRSFTSQVLEGTKPADIARPLGKELPDHEILSRLFSEHFAVLLPLLDILNHRPAALVEWQAGFNSVGLKIREGYSSGQEVFNNYGPRDNEGLLLSYGFVLEDNPFEHVLISINAHPGTPLEIARTWPADDRSNENFNCYIFAIEHPIVEEAKFLERALFSYDLLDSISVMCSNDREFQVMHTKRRTLMSTSLPNMFDDYRNILATLAQIMYDSSARAKRMQSTDPTRWTSALTVQVQKQRNAHIYRQKQIGILQAAEGLCAFALLNACTDQNTSDLLLSMQLNFSEVYSPQLEDICTRLPCLTKKNEVFTASALIDLLPSPTANGVRSCLKNIENAILEAVPSHVRTHGDRVKTSLAVTLSALCQTYRSQTEMPARLVAWLGELTSSYPPEDPNWNYVPPPGPYTPGEEPPGALMTLLGALTRLTDSLHSENATKSWLDPMMLCWGWNVMEEEGLRVPIEIEKFASTEPELVDGITGFLIYCNQYSGAKQ